MDERELFWDTFSNSSGSEVTITHLPTGLRATASGKNRHRAQEKAMRDLELMHEGWLHAQEAPDG